MAESTQVRNGKAFVKYHNKNYPIREVHIDGEDLIVASTSLNNDLFDPKGQYLDAEARVVDEKIFFFLEEDELAKITDKDLRNQMIEVLR